MGVERPVATVFENAHVTSLILLLLIMSTNTVVVICHVLSDGVRKNVPDRRQAVASICGGRGDGDRHPRNELSFVTGLGELAIENQLDKSYEIEAELEVLGLGHAMLVSASMSALIIAILQCSRVRT